MTQNSRAYDTLQRKPSKGNPVNGVLFLVLVAVMVIGLISFASTLTHLRHQDKELVTYNRSIAQLKTDIENYKNSIAAYRKSDSVRQLAESFGMVQADVEHTRIVSVPNAVPGDAAMSAENIQP